MTIHIARFAVLCLLVGGICVAASASIIGTTGSATQIAPPASVVQGSLQSSTQTYIFQEQNGLTLGSAVGVNITSAGTYSSVGSLTPGSITAGTTVDSYLFHAEANNLGAASFSGSITFDQDVIGIIVLSAGLDGTDGILGFSGTTYPTAGSETIRGLELGAPDTLTLSVNGRTITFRDQVSGAQDEFRVITAHVPEPGSMFLIGSGLLGFAGMLRRKLVR